MTVRPITSEERKTYNAVVSHPLQSYEWGEFREKTGVKVIRRGFFKNNQLVSGFQITIHKIPHTPFTIGYLPKGEMPSKEIVLELAKIGKDEKCIFIQMEPNIRKSEIQNPKSEINSKIQNTKYKILESVRPLFTKYTFMLDLTKSEEEILANMHQKARYNIKVAKKYEVEVIEDNSQEAFNEYLKLTEETTRRQKFFAHTLGYHRMMWNTLSVKNSKFEYQNSKQIQNTKNQNRKRFENLNLEHSKIVSDFGFSALDFNQLTAHLLTAKYKGKVLTAWILFVFKDTLYYPYGASSSEHREVMSSNLMMWEAIRFGRKLGLKKFDMWGALGPDPERNDPWYGFHNFKEKYGPEHIEFIGSYDLVINPILYEAYKIADKVRWLVLRLKR